MKSSLYVLNVEDCPVDADLNAQMISARWPASEFVRVDTRADLMDALDGSKFDIILSDFTIPGFDGQEVLSIAREKLPGIPFLYVSGTIGEDFAIEALKNGATDYVLKHRLMRLIPAVDRAIREAAERSERERAEQAMRESEHKYREVFESLDEAAFLADEKTGKIIDTNRCAEKMLGCGRGKILGRKKSEVIAGFDGAAETCPAPFEGTVCCVGGRAVPVHVHTAKLTIYGHPLVLWLCRQLQ